jgi:hypothetical protein
MPPGGGYGAEPPMRRSEEEEGRRPCPMCGEMIAASAIKCRYCGEVFDPTLRRAERSKRARADDSDMNGVDWLLAILCSGIGCIVGIVYAIQGKSKGGKMIGISILFALIWGGVRFAIESAMKKP